jgi:transposase-like protein
MKYSRLKAQIIALYHAGHTVFQLSRQFNIHESTISSWIR